jgi:hypothetical protein
MLRLVRLAANSARRGADAVRYSFIVVDFHHLLLAGLPAHCPRIYVVTRIYRSTNNQEFMRGDS